MIVTRYQGRRVSLAAITPECAELWTRWLNDPEVAIPLGDEAYTPITPENQEAAVKALADGHAFSVVANDEGEIVGRCMVFGINQVDRSAMVGIFIGEKSHWNMGYGEDAMRLLLDYCFCILNLHSVMLGVFEFNRGAIRCYQKVGFREIGRRRQARRVNRRWYDAILMDILEDDYTPEYLGELIRRIAEEPPERSTTGG